MLIFLNYFSLTVALTVLLLAFRALILIHNFKNTKFLFGAVLIVTTRSILPAIHDLHIVNCFSELFVPVTLVFTAFSVNLGYFIYRYIQYILFPLEKKEYSQWHYFPSVILLLNFSYAYMQGINPDESRDYFQAWYDLDAIITMKSIVFLFMGVVLFYVGKVIVSIYRNIDFIKLYFQNYVSILFPIVLIFVAVTFIGIVGIDTIARFLIYDETNILSYKIAFFKPLILIFFTVVLYKNPSLIQPRLLKTDEEKPTPYWNLDNFQTSISVPHEKFKSVQWVKSVILRIEEFVNENQVFRNETYGLSELAADLESPLGHLRFVFQHYCELSFVEYRNYKRVQDFKLCAQNKSVNNHMTIDSIGRQCGFGSSNSLNRSVKKYESCTPRELWNSY